MLIQLTIQHHYVITLLFCSLDVGVLLHLVGGVEIDQITIHVGLLAFYQCAVLIKRIVAVVDVAEEEELLRRFEELLVGQHAIFDEDLDVIPFPFISLAIFFEHLVKLLCHLLRDIARDLLHLLVGLQITAAYIQRYVGRIDNSLHDGHELRHYTLHLVGDEHLIAIQLDAILLDVDVVVDLRKVEDTRQIEGIVHIQMNPEHRFPIHGAQFMIEVDVIFIGQVGRLACP